MDQAQLSKLSELRIDSEQRRPGSSAWPKVLLVFVVLLLGGGGAFVWTQPQISGEIGGKIAAAYSNLQQSTQVSVTRAVIRKTGGSQTPNGLLTASGYVVAKRKASVSSRSAGLLVDMAVDIGDDVKKGQEIGHLEQSREQVQLLSAKAEMAASDAALSEEKTELASAQKALERQKQLKQQGISTQQTFDDADARVQRSHAKIQALEAALVAARTAIGAAEVDLEYTVVRAPFDGRILTKDAEIGEMVAPAYGGGSARGSIVTMANFSELEVEVDVSEAYISRIRPNLPAQIVLDAYPDQTYEGLTRQIVPTANRQKASVQVKVAILAPDEKVLPEMGAKVVFLEAAPPPTTEEPHQYLVVDAKTLHQNEKGSFVFLFKDGVVLEKPVKLGKNLGQELEIMDGLAEGDVVVLESPRELATGMKVKTVD